jgi:ABC-type transport system involved in multi-copper enzyme maturation permease subunit
VYFIVEVKKAGNLGSLAIALPPLVRNYALFHGFIALSCSALAVARIRRVGLAQTYDRPRSRLRMRLRKRPRVGSDPMLWREIHCLSGGHSPWLMGILGTLVLAATFVPPAIIVWNYWTTPYGGQRYNYWPYNSSQELFAHQMNVWVRVANVAAGCLTILAVAIRASTSISTEREKQTLDHLLTTPLSSNVILRAKWLGNMLSVRLGMVWLALIWLLGLVTGGLHILALPMVMAAWITYAAFAAALGMWFSTVSRSSLRATVFTILTLLGLSGGHWLVWMCCGPLVPSALKQIDVPILTMTHAGLFTPPFVMTIFAFSPVDLDRGNVRFIPYAMEMTGICMAGLVVWALGALFLYRRTTLRFQATTRKGR